MTGPRHTPLTRTDGSVLGQKALITRLRILEAFERQVGDRRYRDITMVHVGRDAGTSAANVYQFFEDVEAILFATAALYDGQAESCPSHLRRVLQFVRGEDEMLGVARDPEPDTRLELLATLIPRDGALTAAAARRAFGRLGLRVPIERCEALLRTLADRGQLCPAPPAGSIRTQPTPACAAPSTAAPTQKAIS